MAKLKTILYLEVVAGKAQPAPPLGPMLGGHGVNIGQFVKEFNDKTQETMQKFAGFDMKVKCSLAVYDDRTFKLDIGGLVTSNLILWKLKLKKGSGVPNKEKVGKLTRSDLEEIAEFKKDDMNTNKLESIIATIAGTAKNMGIDVEPGAIKTKEER